LYLSIKEISIIVKSYYNLRQPPYSLTQDNYF